MRSRPCRTSLPRSPTSERRRSEAVRRPAGALAALATLALIAGCGGSATTTTTTATTPRIPPGPPGIAVGHDPEALAAGFGDVWVANRGDGTVTRIDAASGRVVGAPIRVGPEPDANANAGGSEGVPKTR